MLLNTSKSKHEGIERLLDREHLAICELLFATPCLASYGPICYGIACRVNGLLQKTLLWVSNLPNAQSQQSWLQHTL